MAFKRQEFEQAMCFSHYESVFRTVTDSKIEYAATGDELDDAVFELIYGESRVIDGEKGGILWITGGPGAGKTAAASVLSVINHTEAYESVTSIPYYSAAAPDFDDGEYMLDYFINRMEHLTGTYAPGAVRAVSPAWAETVNVSVLSFESKTLYLANLAVRYFQEQDKLVLLIIDDFGLLNPDKQEMLCEFMREFMPVSMSLIFTVGETNAFYKPDENDRLYQLPPNENYTVKPVENKYSRTLKAFYQRGVSEAINIDEFFDDLRCEEDEDEYALLVYSLAAGLMEDDDEASAFATGWDNMTSGETKYHDTFCNLFIPSMYSRIGEGNRHNYELILHSVIRSLEALDQEKETVLHSLADTYMWLAAGGLLGGKLPEAKQQLEAAKNNVQRLIDPYSGINKLGENLGGRLAEGGDFAREKVVGSPTLLSKQLKSQICRLLGETCHHMSDQKTAVRELDAAIHTLEPAAAEFLKVPDLGLPLNTPSVEFIMDYALTLLSRADAVLGHFLADGGETALADCEKAAEAFKLMFDITRHGWTYFRYIEALAKQGFALLTSDPDAAVVKFATAEDALTGAAEALPCPEMKYAAALAHFGLGKLAHSAGDATGSLEHFREAAGRALQLTRGHSLDMEHKELASLCFGRYAKWDGSYQDKADVLLHELYGETGNPIYAERIGKRIYEEGEDC